MFDSGWERGRGAGFSRAWSTESPGVGLVAALVSTAPVDPAVDDGFDAVERLGAWEAVAAWAQACQVQTAADLLASRQARASRSDVAQGDEFAATAMELATMARVAPVTGEHRLHQAVCLVQRLPETLARLREGRIAYSHARVLLEQTHDCTDEMATAADARYWHGPRAAEVERTPTQTRERIRRVLQRVDPASVRRRAAAARRGRTVRYWSDDDGATGVITLRLPAPEARGVFAVIDAAAQQAADPPGTPPEQRRSLGQRRADAAVDLIMNGAARTANDTETATETAAESADAEPADAEPADAEPADAEPADAEPADAEPVDAEPVDAEPGDVEPGDVEPGDVEPGDVEPVDAEPGDVEPVDAEPVDGEPANGEPADGDDLASPAAASGAPRAAGSGGAGSSCGCGGRARVTVQVRVLIPWQTLAGGHEPAELEGHGPIPAEQARHMAAGLDLSGLDSSAGGADVTLQRLLTDPVTGTARHLDLRRYRPPPSLRAFVEDRDQYCHAPGCRRPARACDLDHVIAYDHSTPDGGAGRTHPDGLKPECRRHHNLKTRRQWHCEPYERPGEPPGVRWTSPSGHTWIVRAPSLTEPDLEPDPAPDLATDALVTTAA